ncbi:hypothetical protein BTO06_15780 [Tenacibaculum sp. SZ-18]|nr:hypothetical protein BTO06_15780 [Tenacibaculum sp. SZ-18]
MRGLVLNFASTHQTENPRGFSEVGENKQLLIAIVASSFYSFINFSNSDLFIICSILGFSIFSCPFSETEATLSLGFSIKYANELSVKSYSDHT